MSRRRTRQDDDEERVEGRVVLLRGEVPGEGIEEERQEAGPTTAHRTRAGVRRAAALRSCCKMRGKTFGGALDSGELKEIALEHVGRGDEELCSARRVGSDAVELRGARILRCS